MDNPLLSIFNLLAEYCFSKFNTFQIGKASAFTFIELNKRRKTQYVKCYCLRHTYMRYLALIPAR